MPPPPTSLVAAAALSAVLGCQSIDGYTTAPGESYCGALPGNAAFFSGLDPSAQMRLTLDASLYDGDLSPGTVWTSEPSRRLLDGAPLRRIPTLANDPFGTPDLGSGRDHTRVFALTPSPSGESPLLGVVSLRSDGGVEVRLVRPGLDGTPPPPGQAPLFGPFTLTRQAGTCSF